MLRLKVGIGLCVTLCIEAVKAPSALRDEAEEADATEAVEAMYAAGELFAGVAEALTAVVVAAPVCGVPQV